MIKKGGLIFCWLWCIACFQVSALEAESLVYKEVPLRLPLESQKERILTFDHPVQIWLPTGAEAFIQVEAIQHQVFLKALQTFEELRIRVRSLDKAHVYLFDLSSTASSSRLSQLVKVVHHTRLDHHVKTLTADRNRLEQQARLDWRLQLIRFAAQQLYAPERLRPEHPLIQWAAVEKTSTPYLIRGYNVMATPVARWKSLTHDVLYVTAYRLENHSDETVVLDQRKNIRGDFLASAFQHHTLSSPALADTRQDLSHVTTLYVVSHEL